MGLTSVNRPLQTVSTTASQYQPVSGLLPGRLLSAEVYEGNGTFQIADPMYSVLAERVKKLLVLLDDSFGLIDLDIAAAVSSLEHSAKHYHVSTRKHVHESVFAEEATTKSHVINSRIRWQVDKLSLGRHEVRIFEKCCGTEARAVENDGLLQCQHLSPVGEVTNDILSTGELEVCGQLAQQCAGVDLHGHHASCIPITKRMLARIQIALIRE